MAKKNIRDFFENLFEYYFYYFLIVGLPEVSKLIDSAISKKQGNQRKHTFLEKKILHNRDNGFTINTQKYHIT